MADHYFSEASAHGGRRHEITAQIWDRSLSFTTADGVFSRDGLDHATAVLLAESTPPSSGRLLDLGCGWGAIACAVAAHSPDAEVWAVDSNPRALDLTRENATRHGATVHTSLPDGVPPHLQFDSIWSNPPIRIGKDALHELLLRWLPHLSAEGTARLVVGKNLGADSLQRWLIEQEWPTERVSSSRGFRVLEVRHA
ncbi:class I SAM-dependent methyltransferase [Aeromicrobium sp. CF3.5]|uniref:class I SAM-dependent methyltransferase n=1 Tax=Aeromicrobium sp. CF3.5 TaxID=3373078 RepID=UPI003EE4F3EC